MDERGRDDTRVEQFAHGGDHVERPDRHLAEHGQRLDDGGELVEVLVDMRDERSTGRVAGGVACRAVLGVSDDGTRGRQMALAQLLDLSQRVRGLGGAGFGRHGEKRIRHPAHGGHHEHRPAAVPCAGRANDPDQASNGVGIGHRRAAEFMDDHGVIGSLA